MIGHRGHPETIGTMGQLPEGEVLLVENIEDVEKNGLSATCPLPIHYSYALNTTEHDGGGLPPLIADAALTFAL